MQRNRCDGAAAACALSFRTTSAWGGARTVAVRRFLRVTRIVKTTDTRQRRTSDR